jgi:hypothetical protein
MNCSCGLGESILYVVEKGAGSSRQQSLATIDDCLPMVNIPPFTACTAAANPQAANPSGQKPCTPRFSSQWSDEVEFVTLHGKALLEQRATLACDYGGTVRLLDTAQQTVSMSGSMLKGAAGAVARAAMRPSAAGGAAGSSTGSSTGTSVGSSVGSSTGSSTGSSAGSSTGSSAGSSTGSAGSGIGGA